MCVGVLGKRLKNEGIRLEETWKRKLRVIWALDAQKMAASIENVIYAWLKA